MTVGGRGAVHVARGERDRRAVLAHQKARELRRRGRLSGALQAGHQDHRGRPRRERDPRARAAHQRGELLADDLHDLLAGVQLAEHVGAQAALLDRRRERLDDLEVDVGLEQREADLAHRGADVVLGQRSARADVGERCLELLGERVEHSRQSRPRSASPVASAPRSRARHAANLAGVGEP